MEKKHCNDCGKSKLKTDFSDRTGYQAGMKSSFCKQCMVRRGTEWANKNRKKMYDYQLKYRQKKLWNEK